LANYKNFTNRVTCFICESDGIHDSDIYSKYSEQTFDILRCSNCGLGWIKNPNENYSELYNESYYKGEGAAAFLKYWEERFGSKKNISKRLRELEFLGVFKTLCQVRFGLDQVRLLKHLDYGGGLGGLTDYMCGKGIESCQFEEGYASEMSRKMGVASLEVTSEEKFDWVTAIEVFEHLVDPKTTMSMLADKTKEGGVLLVTTGNLSKHKGRVSKWFYLKNQPDVYITFYTPTALTELMKCYGFFKIDTKYDWHILQYKVLLNLFMLPVVRKSNLLKELIFRLRWILIPFLPTVDRVFGVSKMGIYVRSPRPI